MFYETASGNVVKCVNGIEQVGRCSTNTVFVIEPPIAVSVFLNRWPEAVEVTKIMADLGLSNPNIVVEPTPNATAFSVNVTTVVTAGTPVQLAAQVVPDGRALVVASDNANNTKKLIYVATSSLNALDPTKRVTLSPGGSVKLYVTNADLVWVDSNENGQKAVAIVEL